MNKRILVVEDNSDSLDIIISALINYGYTALIATDAEQGLVIAKAETPDLIICDMELSKFDGYKMAKQLKEDEQLKNIPLIAVSEFSDPKSKEKALAAGFNGCVDKPLHSKILLSQIKEYLKWEDGINTILIVDDRAVNREFLSMLLKYANHRILQASDGAEALKIAQDEHPNLIITDIQMPIMTGVELVKELQSDPVLAKIPVIFYSSIYRYDETEFAKILGVEKILPKPSTPQLILDAVYKLLRKQEATEIKGKEKASEEYQIRMDSRLFTLFEFNLDLITERDQEKLLKLFVQGACKMLDSKYCVLGIFNEKELDLKYYLISHKGLPSKDKVQPLKSEHPFIKKLLNVKNPIKVYTSKQSKEDLPEHPPMDSCLGMPIRSTSSTYGFLYFADKIDNSVFTDLDVELAYALSAQIAVLYENIELYNIVQKLLDSSKRVETKEKV